MSASAREYSDTMARDLPIRSSQGPTMTTKPNQMSIDYLMNSNAANNQATAEPSVSDSPQRLPTIHQEPPSNQPLIRETILPPLYTLTQVSPSSSPPVRRERFGSQSSTGSSNGESIGNQKRGRRPARPKYDVEEALHIWYLRDDLGLSWHQVVEHYNTHYPDRPNRGDPGLQSKYYRILDHFGIKVRKASKGNAGRPKEDIRMTTRVPRKDWAHYPWIINR